MEAKKLFFMECRLAGRQYHDADEVWDELHIGTVLNLVRDTDNAYDKNAVAVIYNGKNNEKDESEQYLLGYLPANENQVIAELLQMGWTNIFECRISKIDPSVHYEDQIHLKIRIKKNNIV